MKRSRIKMTAKHAQINPSTTRVQASLIQSQTQPKREMMATNLEQTLGRKMLRHSASHHRTSSMNTEVEVEEEEVAIADKAAVVEAVATTKVEDTNNKKVDITREEATTKVVAVVTTKAEVAVVEAAAVSKITIINHTNHSTTREVVAINQEVVVEAIEAEEVASLNQRTSDYLTPFNLED
jgi:hypothetical protein